MVLADSAHPVTTRIRVQPPGRPLFYDRRSAKLCRYCERLIMWMFTNTGHKLPFDAELLPKEYDTDNEGWLPGMFKVHNRLRMVMAPVPHHGTSKLDRVSHVAVLHKCPQWITAQAERAAQEVAA